MNMKLNTLEAIKHCSDSRLLRCAERDFVRQLEINPADMGAKLLLGEIWLRCGELTKARDLFLELVGDSSFAGAWRGLGISCFELRDLEGARSALTKAIQLDPFMGDCCTCLAMVEVQCGNLLAGRKWIIRSLSLEPKSAFANNVAGTIAQAQGDLAAAEARFRDAIGVDATYYPAYGNLGLLLLNHGHAEQAVPVFRQAVEIAPESPVAQFNYGCSLHAAGDLLAAAKVFRRAASLDARYTAAWLNLGLVNRGLEQFGEAKRCCQRALELDPNCVEALNLLGVLAYQSGDLERAEKYYDNALRLKNDLRQAINNRALIWLTRGRYAKGFVALEGRFCDSSGRVYIDDPRDSARSVDPPSTWIDQVTWRGMRLLIVLEQGFGDQLFFLRFLPWFRERGVHLTMLCQPRMLPLLRAAGWLDDVVLEVGSEDAFDHIVALGDLPLISKFWETSLTPPAPLALSVDAVAYDAAKRLLSECPRPWIGVTWRAGLLQGGENTLQKNVPLKAFVGALRGTKGTLILLQRGANEGEISEFHRAKLCVFDGCHLGGDLIELTALLSLLDDYVGVSNTNIHLLAALGKVAHILVPSSPEYRWGEAGRTSPWFPGFTVYRQESKGWGNALAALRKDIDAVI